MAQLDKSYEYFQIPFTDKVLSKSTLSKWFRDNKFTIKVTGNTLFVNRKTSVDPVKVTDEISSRILGSKRINAFTVNIKGISIKIDVQLTGQAGKANEFYFVNAVNQYCALLGPITLRFYDKRQKEFIVRNVMEAMDVSDDTGNNKKADVILVCRGKKVPLSLKQGNASFFGAIDAAFKHLFKQAVEYALKHRLLKTHAFNNGENRITPSIAIEPSDDEQKFFMFGSDIVAKHGAIIKQTFTKDSFVHTKATQIDVKVEKIWQSLSDFEDKEKAIIEIRNHKGRNRSDIEISGLTILANVRSKIPKTALWLDRREFA